MLVWYFFNNLDIYDYVGKLPEQQFSVWLFSNPGDNILFLLKIIEARISEWNIYKSVSPFLKNIPLVLYLFHTEAAQPLQSLIASLQLPCTFSICSHNVSFLILVGMDTKELLFLSYTIFLNFIYSLTNFRLTHITIINQFLFQFLSFQILSQFKIPLQQV